MAALTTVLYAFCLVFAVNSAVHSFLIVHFAEGDKVSRGCGARAGPPGGVLGRAPPLRDAGGLAG